MIYLDYNATTPLSENVKQVITDNLDLFYNPSSMYKEGKLVNEKIQASRSAVAKLINAEEDQIVFTGCATESNNSVIQSCLAYSSGKRKHVIISAVEHPAIFETVEYYKSHTETEVTVVPVDELGRINIDEIERSVCPDTVLVSIMFVNNETGNIYPIKAVVDAVRKKNPNAFVHTDATQAVGKVDVDVKALGVDYLTLSGHKIHAPKGVGALFVKDSSSYIPYMHGGHQERNYRAGTENTLSILALGQAANDIINDNPVDRIRKLRDDFEEKVLRHIKGSRVLGDVKNRVGNTSCILIEGLNGIKICTMADEIDDICLSTGSACNSCEMVPSRVMRAMGISQIPIRISIGKYTKEDDLKKCLQALIKIQNKMRRSAL